jgi:hypothetical protein
MPADGSTRTPSSLCRTMDTTETRNLPIASRHAQVHDETDADDRNVPLPSIFLRMMTSPTRSSVGYDLVHRIVIIVLVTTTACSKHR